MTWSSHIFTGTFITLNSGTLLQELFLKKSGYKYKKKRISRAFYSEQFLVVFVKTLFPKCLRFPSLVLIRLVSIEIQRFKNVKINKEMYRHPDPVSDSIRMATHFFVNFDIFKWLYLCTSWLPGSIVANPIIYRLVPSPSRFENRQWWSTWSTERRVWNWIQIVPKVRRE